MYWYEITPGSVAFPLVVLEPTVTVPGELDAVLHTALATVSASPTCIISSFPVRVNELVQAVAAALLWVKSVWSIKLDEACPVMTSTRMLNVWEHDGQVTATWTLPPLETLYHAGE